MGKKKKPDRKPQSPPRFTVGSQVRVKPGVTVPDLGDIPLGGWAGTISEVDLRSDPPLYLIEWNKYTLDHMHPVFVKRCERDGLGMESMWLDENDIEPDPGGPAVIEQPTRIVTRPLDPADQDDRIRAILGLTGDDPLPEVDEDTLTRYHAYLAGALTFPFPAKLSDDTDLFGGRTSSVTVVRLLDADDIEEMYGLLCEAREGGELVEVPLGELDVKRGNPNRRLVEDYSYWFWNWR